MGWGYLCVRMELGVCESYIIRLGKSLAHMDNKALSAEERSSLSQVESKRRKKKDSWLFSEDYSLVNRVFVCSGNRTDRDGNILDWAVVNASRQRSLREQNSSIADNSAGSKRRCGLASSWLTIIGRSYDAQHETRHAAMDRSQQHRNHKWGI